MIDAMFWISGYSAELASKVFFGRSSQGNDVDYVPGLPTSADG
jgi:hypothetical protein